MSDDNGIRHYLRLILKEQAKNQEKLDRVLARLDAMEASLAAKLDQIINDINRDIGAAGATMSFTVIPPRSNPMEGNMASRPANWANGEGYMVTVALTKDDGSAGSVQSGSGKFATEDPNVQIEQTDDTHAKIKATANAAATVTWDGDADLGSGVSQLHAEGVAVFNDSDIQATGATLDFGEPVAV